MIVNIWTKTKVIVINGDTDVLTMFKDRGCIVSLFNDNSEVTDAQLETSDIIVFCGGTDISPNIYTTTIDSRTDTPDSKRDQYEVSLIKRAIKVGLGIVGICRGGQLLVAHLGGSLVQHDTSGVHLSFHNITLKDGSILTNYSASHHQIMLPPKSMEVIGFYNNDTEIAIHRDFGILAFQPHPEWEVADNHNQETFFNMLLEYCI